MTEDTNKFLESQLQDAKRRLLEHEKKLEEYRRRYAGQLPSQLLAICRRSRTHRCRCSRSASPSTAHVSGDCWSNGSSPMHRCRPLPLAAAIATTAAGRAAAPASAAEQLETAEAQAGGLKLRYKPDHPDVRALERADPPAAGEGCGRSEAVPRRRCPTSSSRRPKARSRSGSGIFRRNWTSSIIKSRQA